jgi:hypothetical protein
MTSQERIIQIGDLLDLFFREQRTYEYDLCGKSWFEFSEHLTPKAIKTLRTIHKLLYGYELR